MKFKTKFSIMILILVASLINANLVMPGGPKSISNPKPPKPQYHQRSVFENAPLLTDYNSFFYTFLEAHIFSYHNGTNFSGFWTGSLNEDEYELIDTLAGIYSITGTQPYTLLSGQAEVAGYFAKDENGKGVANKFLTYMPEMAWGGEKFIVFSYTNGTSVVVTDLNNEDTLLATTVDDGQRAELTTTAYGKWLKVDGSNPVSVLSYADQEYSVPDRTGPFVGTDFYTWVGFVGNWQNDLNIVAWHDSTNYWVTAMDTIDTIASGMLNRKEIGCVQTIQNRYVRVTTDKKVSVSVAPYLSWSGAGYSRFTTMRDSTGFGAGNYFVFPVNGAGDMVHVLSFKDNNTITVTDLDSNTVLWTGTLNGGQANATTVMGAARRIEVVSSDLASVDVYFEGYGADFAPLEFAAPGHDVGVTEILAPIGTIPSGTIVTPMAVVHNFSSFTETFDVTFAFTGYNNTKTITNLAPGATDTMEFDPWTAIVGTYNTMAYSQLVGDQNLANDTTYGAFEVTSGGITHDVGVTEIVEPIDTIVGGDTVTPTVKVENFGTSDEDFFVFFNISCLYSDFRYIHLATGEDTIIYFNQWIAEGYILNEGAAIFLEGDENSDNDSITDWFVVIPLPQNVLGYNTTLNYELFRPAPNPTTNNLSIRFALPKPGKVEIAIYDINGRAVKKLISETRTSGTYQINTDCQKLENGVYLIKMTADKFKAIEKFVVAR